ncbi:MAG: TatD family deoxyribonuclease [Flavobacteriia bacterium]|nr:TatD family deoxyribonuclease [Flavobacteriia bacterium]
MRFYNAHTHHFRPIEISVLQASQISPSQKHSFGVHPWLADQANLEEIQHALHQPNCVALGEVGLDRLQGPNLELQLAVLIAQLQFANELQKPVIFHLVRAWDEFFALYASHYRTPWVIHGFNAPKQLPRLLATAIHVSIGPAALRNPQLLPLLATIPLNRLLFETDDELESIEAVYNNFCLATGRTMEELIPMIEQNFLSIFGP